MLFTFQPTGILADVYYRLLWLLHSMGPTGPILKMGFLTFQEGWEILPIQLNKTVPIPTLFLDTNWRKRLYRSILCKVHNHSWNYKHHSPPHLFPFTDASRQLTHNNIIYLLLCATHAHWHTNIIHNNYSHTHWHAVTMNSGDRMGGAFLGVILCSTLK